MSDLRVPVGYICPKCHTEFYDRYRPFCGECGQKMLPEQRLQIVGLAIYPHGYRRIRNLDEISEVVSKIGPTTYWLEGYSATFRTTTIRIQSHDAKSADHEVHCTGTVRLELPIDDGWLGVLSVRASDGMIELRDDENRVFVLAGNVTLCTVDRK